MSLLIIVGTVAKILNRRLAKKISFQQTPRYTNGNQKSSGKPFEFSLLSVHKEYQDLQTETESDKCQIAKVR